MKYRRRISPCYIMLKWNKRQRLINRIAGTNDKKENVDETVIC